VLSNATLPTTSPGAPLIDAGTAVIFIELVPSVSVGMLMAALPLKLTPLMLRAVVSVAAEPVVF
jgi:hypothetical protein